MLGILQEKSVHRHVSSPSNSGPTKVRATVFILNQFAVKMDNLFSMTVQQKMIEHVAAIIKGTIHSL